jgi:uncharacterized glyoxalase superfamily protein PhnB
MRGGYRLRLNPSCGGERCPIATSFSGVTPHVALHHPHATRPPSAQAIAFYEKLGFAVEDRRDDWGRVKLRWGDCRVMLDQSISGPSDTPRNAVLYLHPGDIETFHAQARANGLDTPDLGTPFYGMREFRIHNPDGNRLWIAQAGGADGA